MAWQNTNIESYDLKCGSEVYLGGVYLGATTGDTALELTSNIAEIRQGQPRRLVYSRVTQLESKFTLSALAITPENMQALSNIGYLEYTESVVTEAKSTTVTLTGTTAVTINDKPIGDIVVKSGDVTYVKDTDYTVASVGTASEEQYSIARIEGGAIVDGATVTVNYNLKDYKSFPHLMVGNARDSLVWENICIHKFNPGASRTPHMIIQIWKAKSKSSFNLSFSEDSEEWLSLPLEFEALDDSEDTTHHHDRAPLVYVTWADEFDPGELPEPPAST